MSNTYTGTGGASGLEVRTIDLATDLFGIDIIEVSNGTLTPGASPNIAVIATGGGGGGGVTTINFGGTGLTPAGATGGAVTVAGTLVAANGGTSFSTYAIGDIIYATGATTLAKLTAGANGEVLTLAGGVPSWAASTGGIGGTIADTQVAFGTAADTIGGEPELTYIDTAGSRKFNILDSDAGTTTVLYPLKVSRISTGTAAVGLGVGLEFEAEAPAQAGVNVVGSILESISTAGTTAANTRFDLVIKNHNGSGDPALTNEVARFTSTGGFTTTSSIAGGTTVVIDPVGGGTVTVGGSGGVVVDGTGGVSTVNGAISAGGATGAVSAAATVTGGTGVIATTGGVTATAGGITAVAGNILATTGSVSAGTSVSAATTVSAGTTVTGATGVIATTGGVSALGTGQITTFNGPISAGGATGAVSAATSVSATTTVTAGTGVTATTGDILATEGNVSADWTPADGAGGNFVATAGYSSQIAGQRLNGAIPPGLDLADPTTGVYGAVQQLLGDTYTLGPYTGPTPAPGATATFLCTAAAVTCSVDGANVLTVTGGGATGTGFTCPLNESFTIYCIDSTSFFIFGNVTVV